MVMLLFTVDARGRGIRMRSLWDSNRGIAEGVCLFNGIAYAYAVGHDWWAGLLFVSGESEA